MSFKKESKFSDNLQTDWMEKIDIEQTDENDEQASLLNQEAQDETDSVKKNKNRFPK